MKLLHVLLLSLVAPLSCLPGARGSNSTPNGCGSSVDSLYFNLCDLSAVWGVVVEAFAAAGVVTSLLMLIVLLASLPFATDGGRRSSVGLQAGFLVSTLGLFALTFAFIVGRDFATCASRRFLFGVLFAGCFACLLMQGVRLGALSRLGRGPWGWALCLGALALWLVEVIINTEWLVITVARSPPNGTAAVPVPCRIANQDFAMALIYVMVLLLGALAASVPGLTGSRREWRKGAAFVLVACLFSVGIWVAWIVMYVYGNRERGSPAWDDPTLAIALVSNAWVFLILHAIPEVCSLTEESKAQPVYGEDLYPTRGVGYETILKEQGSQSMFMENKAFSMDEPNAGHNKPVSPYSGYNGQLRSSVYQPTELALITKGGGNMEPLSYETVIPRASAASPASSSSSASTSAAGETAHGVSQPSSGNGVYRKW
ncbi:G-protein coupled receptor family C group 5 member C [Scleropages formosus]|uniref:G protein-coupled receptor class C group 5 member C n=1 Tax=Scleropages formosus TaxID=113540 RepID=A0A8C9W2N4_SCLFO|nr:G-protein coupled receptor family C group 5 member C [Scleropages formosus]XP_029106609.1 G-protein coupled receptor family C group 5 member C [Scleropages formosus]